ncbi:MAG: molybdopterin molybdotransferase MoeA [Oscillospiraceae bacterium]|nr:molybdopterin molybdotransferase MoeA [Oscillospiraceae bacterium]
MLSVVTPEEVHKTIATEFEALRSPAQTVSLSDALGRVIREDISACEYVPNFCRSTVDGYALRASDTFGCSDALPAILNLAGEVFMGESASFSIAPGECAIVPTGGEVPEGADSVQMIEFSENYGDGTIGIYKSTAPGNNMIFRGDDVKPGDTVLKAGRALQPQDIGALAALGITEVEVSPRIKAGIISTGDELVPASEKPGAGQVRDVNSALVAAVMKQAGAEIKCYGIIRDDENLLLSAVKTALAECDIVMISGGSSVGTKDATCRVIEHCGEVLFHGIAMKPGKPTIFGKVGNKPIIGLPGHPVAAMFCTHLFACPLLYKLEGRAWNRRSITAQLTENISANHGRAQYNGVRLVEDGSTLKAIPIRGKSGLITTLAGSDGYICIPRDCEGYSAGQEVYVTILATD